MKILSPSMDTKRPHDIKSFTVEEIVERAHKEKYSPRRWMPLTDNEATMLESMTPDQRNHWFNSLPLEDKLRRWSVVESIEDFNKGEHEQGH